MPETQTYFQNLQKNIDENIFNYHGKDDRQKFTSESSKKQLEATKLLFKWNENLFLIFGINLVNPNNYSYFVLLLYTSLHFVLACKALLENLDNVNFIIDVITELGSIITVITKFTIYKFKSHNIAELLDRISNDYSINAYNSEVEVHLLVNYVTKAIIYFKFIVPMSLLSGTIYFLKNFFIAGIDIPRKIDISNVTFYLLPYRMEFYFPLTNYLTYFSALFYVLPIIPLSAFALIADSTLIIAILAHICGKISILSRCKIRHVFDNPRDFQMNIKDFIDQHNNLISMVKQMDCTFNILMLQQMISVTFLICFIGYSMIVNWSQQEKLVMMMFLVNVLMTLCLLTTCCYAGQCLIDEYLYLQYSLYNEPWYNLKSRDIGYCLLILNRTQQYFTLTGGRFFIFSLKLVVSVLKSAAAYLSVLRTVYNV